MSRQDAMRHLRDEDAAGTNTAGIRHISEEPKKIERAHACFGLEFHENMPQAICCILLNRMPDLPRNFSQAPRYIRSCRPRRHLNCPLMPCFLILRSGYARGRYADSAAPAVRNTPQPSRRQIHMHAAKAAATTPLRSAYDDQNLLYCPGCDTLIFTYTLLEWR